MAIAAVFVLLGFAILALYLGLFKEDPIITIFSGFIFVLFGLTTIVNGFEELAFTYRFPLGIIGIFIGLYVIIRSGIELMNINK